METFIGQIITTYYQYIVTKNSFQDINPSNIEEIKALYKKQCSSIYNTEWQKDLTLLTIIAMGRKYKIDYLQDLVDMYDRDRVRMLKKDANESLCNVALCLSQN